MSNSNINKLFYIQLRKSVTNPSRVRWVSCEHSMVRPQVVDGGNGLQLLKVAADTLNKHLQTAEKGGGNPRHKR
jgi:hypothetical protein